MQTVVNGAIAVVVVVLLLRGAWLLAEIVRRFAPRLLIESFFIHALVDADRLSGAGAIRQQRAAGHASSATRWTERLEYGGHGSVVSPQQVHSTRGQQLCRCTLHCPAVLRS